MSMEKDQDNEPYEPSDSEWYLEDLVDHRTDDMDYVDYEEEGGGRCRFSPPQLNPIYMSWKGVWPKTLPEDWCGSFKPRNLDPEQKPRECG